MTLDTITRAFAAAGYSEVEGRRFALKLRWSESGCLEWTGASNSKGYGCLVLRGVPWLAHRLAHVLFVGPIPEGYEVDHVRDRGCTSITCVLPAHLEAVTPEVNAERARPVPAVVTGYFGRLFDAMLADLPESVAS